ncbi:MAG: YigZ family protein [Clostridia bacterium]|nr:YigZ family protein [Clostridia bacterium]
MELYVTLGKDGESYLEVKRSEFLGYASHVTTEKDARAFVDKIRKKHADARHNVYAYILSENNIIRYSDDGEPQGTAGLPVLDILRKGGITDAVIVVTRYFGGTLLGTGGLVHAYSSAAKEAVEDAGKITLVPYEEYRLTVSYPFFQKIPILFKGYPIIIDSTEFEAEVVITLAIKSGHFDRLATALKDASSGKAKIEKLGTRMDAESLPET